MPSKADYTAISGSYQIHLNEAQALIKDIDLAKMPDEVKQLVKQVDLLQKLTDVYKKAGE